MTLNHFVRLKADSSRCLLEAEGGGGMRIWVITGVACGPGIGVKLVAGQRVALSIVTQKRVDKEHMQGAGGGVAGKQGMQATVGFPWMQWSPVCLLAYHPPASAACHYNL